MRIFAVLLVLSTAAGVVGWLVWEQKRPRPFVVSGFIEAEQVRVGSRVGGRVREVLVEEGREVSPDQPLFRLAPFDLEEQLTRAQAEVAARRAELDRLQAGYRSEEIAQATAKRERAAATLQKLQEGPRPQEIEIARLEQQRAQSDLDLAESEFQRLQRLKETARAAQTELDEAQRVRANAQAKVAVAAQELELLREGTRAQEISEARALLAEAEASLTLLRNGYRKEDIAVAEARLAAAEAEARTIQQRIDELEVTSPCACVVEAIDLQPGDLVPSNAPAVSLLDLSRLWVRAYVPEARLSRVRLNQPVPVLVDGFPGERFAGRVTFVATAAEFVPGNVQTPEERSKQAFRIKVTLHDPQRRLRVGASANLLLDETVAP